MLSGLFSKNTKSTVSVPVTVSPDIVTQAPSKFGSAVACAESINISRTLLLWANPALVTVTTALPLTTKTVDVCACAGVTTASTTGFTQTLLVAAPAAKVLPAKMFLTALRRFETAMSASIFTALLSAAFFLSVIVVSLTKSRGSSGEASKLR